MARQNAIDLYFPFFVSDWLTGEATSRMTPEQKGAFIDLLAWSWKSSVPCTLPDDEIVLQKYSGMAPDRWKAAGRLVRAQFVPVAEHPGRIRNPKLWSVYEAALETHRLLSDAGRKSAERRAQQKAAVDAALADVTDTEFPPAPKELVPVAIETLRDLVRPYAGLATACADATLRDTVARALGAVESKQAYAAEMNAALEGMHGAMLTPSQLADGVADWMNKGNWRRPNIQQFRRYLAGSKHREPPPEKASSSGSPRPTKLVDA